MASNVITFITVAALATCLATVSGQLFPLPADVYCTASNNTACTQRYPNTVCQHEEEVCKYGDSCWCAAGYALYSFDNSTTFRTEYSCRPATVPLEGLCSNPLGTTCTGSGIHCRHYNSTYSVCKCNTGYKPNSDGTDCKPIALELGQNCSTSNGPCGANAYCENRELCRCKLGYKAYDSTDCTHYVPGEACPVTECEFPESNAGSCGYGTCKDGVFACIPGSQWWQTSTFSGMCLKNTATLVGTGELCDRNPTQTSDYVCRSNRCVTCPERSDVYICNGATFSKTMSAATALLLLLACYLFH